MSEYPNSGTLFKNDKKTETKHKDSNGSGELTCQHCGEVNTFWIVGWRKVSQTGKHFLSMSFQPKEVKQAEASTATDAEYDEDIPF